MLQIYVNFHHFELNTFLYKIIHPLQTNYNNMLHESTFHVKKFPIIFF